MQRLPLLLAVMIVLVLAYAITQTIYEDVVVAPWAQSGGTGRLHPYAKNVVRVGGTAADVQRAIARAVELDTAAAASPPMPAAPAPGAAALAQWQQAIVAQIRPAAQPTHVVALAADGTDAPAWALPGAYWAAYAGAPVVFVGRDSLSSAAADAVRRARVPVYVLAPASLVSDRVLAALARIAPTVRVAGHDLAAHAVAVAEYRDEKTGVGWGRDHGARTGYFDFVISAPSEANQAIAALPLAREDAATFLFSGDDGGLPAATDRYVWSQQADWFVTPAETPYREFWVVGDRLSYASVGRLDLAVEKSAYLTMGEVALGPLEALAIAFIALGVAGALLVLVHGQRFLPDVMPTIRVAWGLTALVVPVLGVILYFAAYRRPLLNPGKPMPKWLRPPAIQAAAATAMGFGYGAPLMIAIAWLFGYFGLPLFFGSWADGWQFVFGAGMPQMMFWMYVLAVVISWLLMMIPMRAMMSKKAPGDVAGLALGVMSLGMAVVSLGMMAGAWWLMMSKNPMMPKEDDIMWLGTFWFAATLGFLVAWPLNWPMVRTRIKSGVM